MSTDPVHLRRVLAVLNLPDHKTPEYIHRARAILRAMTGNPNFPSPSPPLGLVAAAIDALNEAEVSTLTRAAVTYPVRDEARRRLHTLLLQLCVHAQWIADGDPDHAESIVESAGMFVKRRGVRRPRVFAAKCIASGTVMLIVPSAGKYASYEWAMSRDEQQTWETLPPTKQATTIVKGLTPGSRVYFRYLAVTQSGPTDWRPAISIIVT
jgi:hypothetical protein